MFDERDVVVGLWPGETSETLDREVDVAFEATDRELAEGWTAEERHFLPDLGSLPAGPFLSVLVEHVDRSRLNGFDLVRLLQARERLVAHFQAQVMADTVEVSYAAAGDADADPERLSEAFQYASDEIRAALGLTRRSAEYRLSFASDLMQRLPLIWKLFSEGVIDLGRVRVISDGTAHLSGDETDTVIAQIAGRAPRLTTGELAAWIRRLCVESDPEQAEQRVEQAREQRRLVIEATVDGTGNLHLFDIDVFAATAIGKRVNTLMCSLRRDGDTRSHDNLRADIAVDLLLGADPTNHRRGLVDMRVSLTTLAGLDEKAAEIPGMGPVIADIARRYADAHPNAEWQASISDDHGNIVDVVTTTRRPNRRISRLVDAAQPTCSFPGCRMPATDCDYDHLLPVSQHGATSTRNGGPKCRHDHILKDHGWTHQRHHGQDIWTSPLGHTYKTEKPP